MSQQTIFRKTQFWCLLLLILTIAITIAYGFVLVSNGPANFDAPILLWFRNNLDTARLVDPDWITQFWLGLTWLGNTTPRITVAVLTIIGFLFARRRQVALFIAGVLISGISLSSLLKDWIGRPRPQLVPYLDHVSSQSFPSGHALNSTLFYLTIAIFVVPLVAKPTTRWSLYALAILMALATGISRVALGVHWPSDVLAGWVIAVAWLGIWAILATHFKTKVFT